MSKHQREKQQNHFIIAAVVVGLVTYWITGGNIGYTILTAIGAGLISALVWK